jgi:3-oxoacyl-[acyl-carrier-protein] synthase III
VSRSAIIRSTGAHVPEREITNDQIRARIEERVPDAAATIAKLAAASGIERRFYAPDDRATSDLAVLACKEALTRADLSPEAIDLVIVGTDSPDLITPSTSVLVQHKLGAKRAGTFDVGCACASFPTALAAASGLIATNRSIDRVLVAGAYMMRKLADPADPMSFFYGDGAGACVVEAADAPGIIGVAMRADGAYADHWSIASGGTREPATEASVRAGRTHVVMREKYPPEINEEGWPLLVRRLAEEHAFSLGDIDLLIFTQVRKTTIETVMRRLELPMERTHLIMQRWGYTGSACIPMALDDAVNARRVSPGDLVVMVGSGVGFNQAAVAVRMTERLARRESSPTACR